MYTLNTNYEIHLYNYMYAHMLTASLLNVKKKRKNPNVYRKLNTSQFLVRPQLFSTNGKWVWFLDDLQTS